MSKRRLVISVILLVCVALISLYVVQSMGVCLKEGRVLSPEELRQRVLLSFVNLAVRNESALAGTSMGNNIGYGISHSVSEIDINKLLEELHISEKYIKDSLRLNQRDMQGLFWADEIKEPFLYVELYKEPGNSYKGGRVGGYVTGAIYISSEIQEKNYRRTAGAFNKQWLIGDILKEFKVLLNGLCGFNNHYFEIKGYYFRRECTEEMFANENLQEECKEKRRKAYETNLKNMKEPEPIRFAAISNCGDILTESHDMGLPTRYVQWVY